MHIRNFQGAALLLLILLVSVSCSDILVQEAQVQIDLLLDDHGFADTAEFRLTGTREGTDDQVTVNLGSGLSSALMHLSPGTWTFTVQAFRADEVCEGEGSSTVTVEPGEKKSLLIDIVYDYVLSFDLNYENAPSDPESIEVTYGSPYGTLPEVTPRTGYTFLGWFNGTGEEAAQITDETLCEVKEGQTLYARWKAHTHTVSFDSNGGSAEDAITVTYDGTYEDLPAPTLTGYTFDGWFTSETDDNGTGTKITSTSAVSVTQDITLHAAWRVNNYTISFDSNGGTAEEDISVTYNSTYESLPTPSRNGYTFTGWYTAETDDNGTGSKITSTATVSVTQNITLHAAWDAKTYQVSFSLEYDDAPEAPTPIEVVYDAAYGTLPSVSDPPGYTFLGWYDGSLSGASLIVNSTVIQTAKDHILYAHWDANSYKAAFDSNGGSEESAITVTNDSSYGTLPVPTRDGYSFKGWYLEETDNNGSGGQVTSSSTVSATADLMLYAAWSANDYIVSFDSNGGSAEEAISVTYDGTYEDLPAPTLTGYTFDGWFTSETDDNGTGTKITSTSAVSVTQDITLHAAWSVNTYTVSFDSNGGSAEEAITVTYDSTYGTLPSPTRNEYVFEGWYISETENNGSGNEITSSSTVDILSAITLYAQWSMTDATIVARDKNSLALIYQSEDSESSVTQNLGLPLTGTLGSTISWSNNNDDSLIETDGTVHRPTAYDGDATATLKATITYGEESDTETYTLTIKALDATDYDFVRFDRDALGEDDAAYLEGDSQTSVKGDFTLPVSGSNGSTISWTEKTDTSDALSLESSGNARITRPALNSEDAEVILTATLTKGSSSVTKDLTFTVKQWTQAELDTLDIETDAASLALEDFSFTSPDTYRTITEGFTVPTAGAHETSISWRTDDSTLSITGGDVSVTRPIGNNTNNTIVTLQATITKGEGTSHTKDFSLTVLDIIDIGTSYYGYRLATDPSDGELFYLEGGYNNIAGIYSTSDGGREWKTLSVSGLPTGSDTANYGSALTVSADGTVYVLSKVNLKTNVYSLADGTSSWTQVGDADFATATSAGSGNTGKIVVDRNGNPYAMAEKKVWTLDSGLWTDISPVGCDYLKSDIFADGDNLYFIGYNYTDGGFLVYRRSGGSWTLLNPGQAFSGYSGRFPSISASGNTVTAVIPQSDKTITMYRYNGIAWTEASDIPSIQITAGVPGIMQSLTVGTDSYIVAASVAGTENGTVARYDGTTWTESASFTSPASIGAIHAAYDPIHSKIQVLNSYTSDYSWDLYSVTP